MTVTASLALLIAAVGLFLALYAIVRVTTHVTKPRTSKEDSLPDGTYRLRRVEGTGMYEVESVDE